MSSPAAAPTRSTPTRARVLRGTATPTLRANALAELVAPAPITSVIASARQAAEEGYAAGFGQGHAEGYEEGRALAAAEAAESRRRLERAWSALTVAARTLDERAALELEGVAKELADAALVLAEAVLGRELACAENPGADALARALALVPAGDSVVARLHPEDAAVLDAVGATAIPSGVTVVADPSVTPGGCLLEAGDSRIDAQLAPALLRARAALLGEDV